MINIIEIKNLSKVYDNEIKVLDNIGSKKFNRL